LASSRKKRSSSIQISKELASDLAEASAKVNEVLETLEVKLDKQTLRRLKLGEKEYRTGKYKVARTQAQIDKVLST
jgi:exonuclease VII small subunit